MPAAVEPMRCAVVLTTYEQPAWLDKTLWGFRHQTDRSFELIVADDGSGAATRTIIEQHRQRGGLIIRHIWHPDRGFQKCQILNHAIAATQADYVIFTDGDCVPHRDFVAWHRFFAQPRQFLSGGYLKLQAETSAALRDADIAAGHHTDPAWLYEHGEQRLSRNLKLRCQGGQWAKLYDRLTTTRPSWNGHNASTWRAYILAANGFDHRMQYGGQDREFGERLVNAGIKPKQIRHHAICLHLDHPRGYAKPESIAKNRAIRAETRRSGRTYAESGLAQRDTCEVRVDD